MMDRQEPPGSLVGRSEDRAWLTALLRTAAQGRGAVGVLRGDAGIGKTFLVSAVTAQTPQLRMHLVAGVEAEADLPYAALQRMVLAHRPALADLTEVQRSALLTACGLAGGPPAARALVGLGLLSLLARLSDDAPLVCFIDDSQWIDPESLAAFGFVARRLLAERTALLFAVRTGVDLLDDLPARTLAGLNHDDALTLLTAVSPRPVNWRIADRIITATGGNPLALVDLVADLTDGQLRGEEPLPEPVPVGKRLEAHYLRHARSLPPETQTWLLAAAAEPDGNLDAIASAGKSLGLPEDAASAAELAGLVRVGASVTFRHPLVRSAIYNGAPSSDIRAVHGHLAGAAERRGDTYRRATHRAAATLGVDDGVADELEKTAEAATRRGGYLTRVALLRRAAALTSNAAARDLRLLAAGEAAIAAGAGAQARALLQTVGTDRLDDVARGRFLVAQCELEIVAPRHDSAFAWRAQRLLEAARLFRAAAPGRAKHTLASVFWALVQADELVQGTSSRDVAVEARDLCAAHPGTDLPTQGLLALSTLVLSGPAAAAPLVRRAVQQSAAPQTSDDDVLQSYMCIAYAACLLRDADAGAAVINRAEHIARNRGAILALCRILLLGAHLDLQQGRVRDCSERLGRAAELVSFMGLPEVYVRLAASAPALIGWAGGEAVTREDALSGEARASGYGMSGASRQIGTMLLRASQGRYPEAWAAGRRIRHEDPLFSGALHLPDLIECAARAGDRESASNLLRRLQAESLHTGSDWAAGLLERSMAHLADGEAAPHFERALELLDRPALEMDAARTHLLYGEWLRRRRHRNAAAPHLTAARAAFQRLGAPSWAERASRELSALGDKSGQDSAAPASSLTAQEVAVARLAAAGNTNADIAARLFLSSNTVDYHLRKVFRKLGVTSRRQLRDLDRD